MHSICLLNNIWSRCQAPNSLMTSGACMCRATSVRIMVWLCSSPTCELNQCWLIVNTLRPRQNGRHFADDTFSRIFVNENVRISIEFSLKSVPKGPINNIPALVQIIAWRRPGDKPLSETVMVSLLTHICVTRPQWVNMMLRRKLRWNPSHHTTLFIKKNAFENTVYEMTPT